MKRDIYHNLSVIKDDCGGRRCMCLQALSRSENLPGVFLRRIQHLAPHRHPVYKAVSFMAICVAASFLAHVHLDQACPFHSFFHSALRGRLLLCVRMRKKEGGGLRSGRKVRAKRETQRGLYLYVQTLGAPYARAVAAEATGFASAGRSLSRTLGCRLVTLCCMDSAVQPAFP